MQHRSRQVQGFTSRYGTGTLVWLETHETMLSAIQREKALKKWYRDWKLELIEEANPTWRDLYDEVVSGE